VMTLPTQLPIIEILRTSSSTNSANFAFTAFSEVPSRNTAYADSTLADRCERSVFFAQIKALREPLR
jgi:hypothetical protein